MANALESSSISAISDPRGRQRSGPRCGGMINIGLPIETFWIFKEICLEISRRLPTQHIANTLLEPFKGLVKWVAINRCE